MDGREAAREIAVPGTPTFVLGRLHGDGSVVGWPVVGMPPFAWLAERIGRAETALAGRSQRGRKAVSLPSATPADPLPPPVGR